MNKMRGRKRKKIKKVAVPVENGKLCEHFGKSNLFYVFKIKNNKIAGKEIFQPPPHDNGVYPKWLVEQGITDVITGGIGQKAIDIFLEAGINVFDGAPVDEPENLVQDFLAGKLESYGNFCDH